jgi:aspartate aminotransferase
MRIFPASAARLVAQRARRIPTSVMLETADVQRHLRQAGKHIIDLSLGQPEVPPPPHVVAAAQRALQTGSVEYAPSAGLAELRVALSERLRQDDGSEVSPVDIIVTCGSKHALYLALTTTIDEGDEVLVPDPCFPPYREIVAAAGGRARPVRLLARNRYAFDLTALERRVSHRTKALVLNYPNNPCGWSPSREELRRILELATERGFLVISDEIYDKIRFDGTPHTHLAAFPDFRAVTLMIGGFSKTYSMVPYRLGFLVAPRALVPSLIKLQRCTLTTVSPFIQLAGVAALQGPQDYVEERRRVYEARRNHALRLLDELNVPCVAPRGALYAFPDLSEFALPSMALTQRLLTKTGVAVTPGIAFGRSWNHHARLAFTATDTDFATALDAFAQFLRGLRRLGGPRAGCQSSR